MLLLPLNKSCSCRELSYSLRNSNSPVHLSDGDISTNNIPSPSDTAHLRSMRTHEKTCSAQGLAHALKV